MMSFIYYMGQTRMKRMKLFHAYAIAIGAVPQIAAQAERIKAHGTALEGNLER
jgi:hypothetical protein